MNYRLSVITPVYKAEGYLQQCCRSLFASDMEGIEFIFVDDCSPDASMEVLSKAVAECPSRAADVRILRHETNRGVAAARNTGLSAASGEYVAFADADDWVEPDMFSRMYSLAESGNLDFVGCDWHLEFGKSSRVLRQPACTSSEAALEAMFCGNMRWYLWAFMIRRSLFADNGVTFIEGADIGEDMAALVKCLAFARSYGHISAPLYHHVKYNVASLTNMAQQTQLDMVRRNVDSVSDFFRSRFGDKYELGLDFLKLNVKFPLLVTDDSRCYDLWRETFPEADRSVWMNPRQPLRNKMLQSFARHHCDILLKLYYRVLFKFVYGVLYR